MRSTNGYSLIDIEQVLPEEKFEASLNVDSSVYLAPWRSLWASDKLHLVKIPAECRWTVLKWEWEIPEISKVITSSNISRVFCTSTGRRCPLPSFLYPDYVSTDIFCSQNKSGVFFMGWSNNKLRKHIFNAYSGRFSVTLRDSYSADARNKDYRNEYITGLSSAKFSLCPKGVGSGTRRFWESLKAGAVPILISDELELPKIWDWDATIIRISEAKALYCPNSIYNATVSRGIEQKSEMCKKAHEFFSSAKNISNYLADVTSQRI